MRSASLITGVQVREGACGGERDGNRQLGLLANLMTQSGVDLGALRYIK